MTALPSVLSICLWQSSGTHYFWAQNYDPTHHWWFSTFWAALPLVLLLVAMMVFRMAAHRAALLSLAAGLAIAIGIFHMPLHLGVLASLYGAGYGLFPVFWIIFPVFFLYDLTVKAKRFPLLQQCLVGITEDSRLQLLLIAFLLGAFFEGVAGFGTPVAVCATLLIGLGFEPLQAAGLSLLANTAPVALGSLGIPIVALHAVTGLDVELLGRVVTLLLVPFCVLIPFWLIWLFAGFRAMVEVWPAILITGVTFATAQALIAQVHGPWLVDVLASIISMVVLVLFLRVWKPRRILNAQRQEIVPTVRMRSTNFRDLEGRAALPWAILTACVIVWGTPQFSGWLNRWSTVHFAIAGLHDVVLRMPPVAAVPTPETAIFNFNWLAATGTGIFIAALIAGVCMQMRAGTMARSLWDTIVATRFTFVTLTALMGLGFLARFCGSDATVGLALARTGVLYPFFAPLVGWLGTAATGSDTSSNVLFGNLQQVTAQQLHQSPYLMASANTCGGVMGKMIATQSVVVATTATNLYGREGSILRFLLLHSLALACLMGLEVLVLTHLPTIEKLVLR